MNATARRNPIAPYKKFNTSMESRFLRLVTWVFLYSTAAAQKLGVVEVPFSGWSETDDGSWGTVQVFIGAPPQPVYLLVSTFLNQHWVVNGNVACGSATFNKTTVNEVNQCFAERGRGFFSNYSTTWHDLGLDSLGGRTSLAMTAQETFGSDILGLTNQITLQNMEIGLVTNESYAQMGFLGLGSSPFEDANTNTEYPAMVPYLKSTNIIGSQCWGYTAGASYKSNGAGVFGSLTLGAYNTTRYLPNAGEISFPLNQEANEPRVNLQRLSFQGSNIPTNLTKPLNVTVPYVAIDSTTPFLWLPAPAYELFEQAFSLVFDTASGLYLLNQSRYNDLLSQDGSVTFGIGNDPENVININISFSAFARQAKSPFLPPDSFGYFPLQRATEANQNTLGRAFLQEAYVRVDYDNRNFTVNPARFPGEADAVVQDPRTTTTASAVRTARATTTLVAMQQSSSASTSPAAASSNKLAIGLGTSFGVVGALSVTFGGMLLFRRRRAQMLRHSNSNFSAEGEMDVPEMSAAFASRTALPLSAQQGVVGWSWNRGDVTQLSPDSMAELPARPKSRISADSARASLKEFFTKTQNLRGFKL